MRRDRVTVTIPVWLALGRHFGSDIRAVASAKRQVCIVVVRRK